MLMDDYFEKLCLRLRTFFGSPLIHILKDVGRGVKRTFLKLL